MLGQLEKEGWVRLWFVFGIMVLYFCGKKSRGGEASGVDGKGRPGASIANIYSFV